MKTADCQSCQAQLPLGELLSVGGVTLCASCAQAAIDGSENPAASAVPVAQITDPTVCIHCQVDQGDEELPLVAGLPTCPDCEARLRNWPYPGWLKAAALSLVAAIVVSMVFNLRFFQAYLELNRAQRAYASEQFTAASDHMASAAKRVPEVTWVAHQASLYRGIHLLWRNDDAGARDALAHAMEGFPNEPLVATYYHIACLSAAFEEKAYDKMLEHAERAQTLGFDVKNSHGMLTSAQACMYASTGEAKYRDEARESLARYEELETDVAERDELRTRIEHRLATREIIDGEEFQRRFPQGWKADAEAAPPVDAESTDPPLEPEP